MTVKELSNRLNMLESETNIKPRLFQFPELRGLMQQYEKEGLDYEAVTYKTIEYYQEHYGSIDFDHDPSLLFGMVLVG